MISESKICYICGEIIDNNPLNAGLRLSMDHIPPKQFYPKQIRQQQNLNLELVPSHKKCNEDYREDEEYFYHSIYPLVAESNRSMGDVIFQDFKRRSHKPQTPAMIRKITKTASKITQGGIHLPTGKIELSLDEYRLQRVVIKIARGALRLNNVSHIPASNCIDLRLHHDESEAIEIYKLSWKGSPLFSVHPKVFSYKYFYFENNYLITLLFWESVMYCLCFVDKPTN